MIRVGGALLELEIEGVGLYIINGMFMPQLCYSSTSIEKS